MKLPELSEASELDTSGSGSFSSGGANSVDSEDVAGPGGGGGGEDGGASRRVVPQVITTIFYN